MKIMPDAAVADPLLENACEPDTMPPATTRDEMLIESAAQTPVSGLRAPVDTGSDSDVDIMTVGERQ